MSQELNQEQPTVQPPSAPKPNNRKLMHAIVAGIVALVVTPGLIVFLMSNVGKENQQTQQAPSAQVSITADGFEPATVMIKAGASVAWVNIDSNPHQIASDPHPTHSSFPDLYAPEPVGTNDVYSMIFEKAGTYTYHDNLNPYTFKGVVIVE